MGFFDKFFKKSAPIPKSGYGYIQEPFIGAWERNMEVDRSVVSVFYPIYACVSLISKDMGKMGIKLKKRQKKVLVDTKTPKDLEILMKKPNAYQTWQQFHEFWTVCLLLRGNCYIFKVRDIFGNVVKMHILDPDRVQPLISSDGKVFYRLYQDHLNGTEAETIPSSEIIHDRINCFNHPLVGLSPILACGVQAGIGMDILGNQSRLFKNGARPGGILVAPGPLDKEKAKDLQDRWNTSYGGANVGKTAVLSDGLQYQQLSLSSADAQVVEQLKMSAEVTCSVFHVPPHKIGLVSTTGKVADISENYFSDCIQAYVESRENLLDDGLNLDIYGVECFLDTDALIRMDKESKINFLKNAISAGIMSPNEARAELGLLPVVGGESPVMQQQNYSLAALSKRDAKEDPFNKESTNANNSDTSAT